MLFLPITLITDDALILLVASSGAEKRIIFCFSLSPLLLEHHKQDKAPNSLTFSLFKGRFAPSLPPELFSPICLPYLRAIKNCYNRSRSLVYPVSSPSLPFFELDATIVLVTSLVGHLCPTFHSRRQSFRTVLTSSKFFITLCYVPLLAARTPVPRSQERLPPQIFSYSSPIAHFSSPPPHILLAAPDGSISPP